MSIDLGIQHNNCDECVCRWYNWKQGLCTIQVFVHNFDMYITSVKSLCHKKLESLHWATKMLRKKMFGCWKENLSFYVKVVNQSDTNKTRFRVRSDRASASREGLHWFILVSYTPSVSGSSIASDAAWKSVRKPFDILTLAMTLTLTLPLTLDLKGPENLSSIVMC